MVNTLKDKIAARTSTIQRGQPYRVGPANDTPNLPASADELPEQLQLIARQYLGAQKRSGEALLDAARWLSEARAIARHGEWQLFLEATSTSETTAKRMIDIHTQAMQNPQFAEGVRSNWLQFTVAADLAQPSTSPELIEAMISAPARPTKADVQRTKAQAKSTTVADLPRQLAPPEPPALAPRRIPAPAAAPWLAETCAQFGAAAEHARWCASRVGQLSEAERAQLRRESQQLRDTLDRLLGSLQ